jgi:threonylcarbamoyladenosine tRNA methylthiotransferase MtaB
VSTFFVQNFGCRATQADGAAIERQFRERGMEPAPTSSTAQVVVLNTCTVTAAADQDARAAVRRVHRENPGCQIVVTGCYAQRAPEEIAALPGVTQVIGNSHKHQLANFVPVSNLRTENQELRTEIHVSDIFAHTELQAAPVFEAANARTRPNLKVQDGCDNRCSFCVIPYVRGQSRSLPLPEILREVRSLVDAGYREVVISGINLGRWGRDLPQSMWDGPSSPPFENLITTILERSSLEKLRISSVEPMDWSDELIRLMSQSPRIAKHAHVPLQSGSDRILRQMHRKYRPWHYREKIEKIRAAMPTAAIGADVMVGFPGETVADFDETRHLIEDLPFTYLHVFTYSSRPGTPAAAMPNPIPVELARERNRILREIAAEKKHAFMKSFVGQAIDAITLREFDGTHTEALTDNYLKLELKGRHEPNRWLKATVERVEGGTLLGTA